MNGETASPKKQGFALVSRERHLELSSLGGRIGGRARVKKGLALVSPERRHEICMMAVEKRWGKKPASISDGRCTLICKNGRCILAAGHEGRCD
jgi:hypothetical protein